MIKFITIKTIVFWNNARIDSLYIHPLETTENTMKVMTDNLLVTKNMKISSMDQYVPNFLGRFGLVHPTAYVYQKRNIL